MASAVNVGNCHLTPSQQRILGYIAAQTAIEGSAQCTKRDLADMFNCDVKTVDRAISHLRREGVIEVVPRYRDNGAQLGNAYRIAQTAS